MRISPHGVRNREHYADPAARETAARLLPQPVLAHADPLSALFRLLLSLWKGRGLSAVGPRAGDAVTELLLGEGRRPDTDRIESELLAEGRNPARARRATVLGRPIEHNQAPKIDKAKERTPWLAFDNDVPATADGAHGRSEVASTAWYWSCARTSSWT